MSSFRFRRAWCRLAPLICLVAAADPRPARAAPDYYWRLGAGTYGTPGPGDPDDVFLTHARFDWQMIAFGSGADLPAINRCLALNPRQRFLVRLWPRQQQDSFLDYLYRPEVRERIDQAIHAQVERVQGEIARPRQVLAYTFLEELPSRWDPCYALKSDTDILAVLAPHREAIERDLGRPLVLDAATKAWLDTRFVDSMDQIHTTIRRAAGRDPLILFWPRFDWFDVATLERIIHPGGADGVFIYVLRPDRWQEHVRIAEARGWPFFSQLSHNSGMKQGPWTACVDLPLIQSRFNLGYFLYSTGNPLRPHWYDNPAVNRVNNVRGFSNPVHLRWFAADRNLGWDVFRRHLSFAPRAELRLQGQAPGDAGDLFVLVPNPILEGHFSDVAEQRVHNVVARLKLPSWLERAGGDAEAKLGNLEPSRHRAPAPGSFAVAHWRLRLKAAPRPDDTLTVAVRGRHPRLGRIKGLAHVTGATPCTGPAFEAHPVVVSGQGWIEPGFGLTRDLVPALTLQSGARPIPNPSLTDGELEVAVDLGRHTDNADFYRLTPVAPTSAVAHRLTYTGTLPPHHTLAVQPGGNATLAPTRPLLDARLATADAPGPGATNGYFLGRQTINRPLPPGEPVVVTLSGRRSGKVSSHVVANFRCADTGRRQGATLLTNRLQDDWRAGLSQTVVPPFTNAILESLSLYRYPHPAEGTVWYGSLHVDLASLPSAGKDVSASIGGTMPVLRAGQGTVITYFDDDRQQPHGDKAVVRFEAPAP